MDNKGMVYLVGAGPGDNKLITIKGKECIEQANVIIYDRLVNKMLLNYTSDNTEIIYVGKSPQGHTFKQWEINELLAAKALEGRIVVRLKGGDPFIFGRGGEEALFLKEKNIPLEIIPGVTSAAAVPAYAGIPVTHRGIASSVCFITGNEDPEKESSDIDWEKLAGTTSTLVFLMGTENLVKIVNRLMENGCSSETPVAVIQWGTLANQKTLTGTLGNIAQKCSAEGSMNPSVIVVGDVVSLRDKINWYESRPLFGKKILVTRSRSQAGLLSEKIMEMGGEAYEFPTIDIKPPDNFFQFDKALRNLNEYKWIIFTSVNGVEFFLNRLFELDGDVRDLGQIKIGALGPKTQEALSNYGLIADFVPGEYRTEAIIDGLTDEEVSGEKILLPRADIARKTLPEGLSKKGAEIHEITAYKTVMGSGDVSKVTGMLLKGEIDVVTFTSSSTVINFATLVGQDIISKILEKTFFAAIGPVTANTAEENGIKIDIIAQEFTVTGMLKAIVDYYN